MLQNIGYTFAAQAFRQYGNREALLQLLQCGSRFTCNIIVTSLLCTIKIKASAQGQLNGSDLFESNRNEMNVQYKKGYRSIGFDRMCGMMEDLEHN